MEIPRWMISTLVFWMLGIGLLAVYGTDFEKLENALDFVGDIGAVLCFAMRDFAIILYFKFSAKPQRTSSVALLYLIILYILLPLLMFSLDLDQLTPLFYPIIDEVQSAPSIIPAFIEAILIWILVVNKWKRSPHYQLA